MEKKRFLVSFSDESGNFADADEDSTSQDSHSLSPILEEGRSPTNSTLDQDPDPIPESPTSFCSFRQDSMKIRISCRFETSNEFKEVKKEVLEDNQVEDAHDSGLISDSVPDSNVETRSEDQDLSLEEKAESFGVLESDGKRLKGANLDQMDALNEKKGEEEIEDTQGYFSEMSHPLGERNILVQEDKLAVGENVSDSLMTEHDNLEETQTFVKTENDHIEENKGLLKAEKDDLEENKVILKTEQDDMVESKGLLKGKKNDLEESQEDFLNAEKDEMEENDGFQKAELDDLKDNHGFQMVDNDRNKENKGFLKAENDDLKESQDGFLNAEKDEVEENDGFQKAELDDLKDDYGLQMAKNDRMKQNKDFLKAENDNMVEIQGFLIAENDDIEENKDLKKVEKDDVQDSQSYLKTGKNYAEESEEFKKTEDDHLDESKNDKSSETSFKDYATEDHHEKRLFSFWGFKGFKKRERRDDSEERDRDHTSSSRRFAIVPVLERSRMKKIDRENDSKDREEVQYTQRYEVENYSKSEDFDGKEKYHLFTSTPIAAKTIKQEPLEHEHNLETSTEINPNPKLTETIQVKEEKQEEPTIGTENEDDVSAFFDGQVDNQESRGNHEETNGAEDSVANFEWEKQQNKTSLQTEFSHQDVILYSKELEHTSDEGCQCLNLSPCSEQKKEPSKAFEDLPMQQDRDQVDKVSSASQNIMINEKDCQETNEKATREGSAGPKSTDSYHEDTNQSDEEDSEPLDDGDLGRLFEEPFIIQVKREEGYSLESQQNDGLDSVNGPMDEVESFDKKREQQPLDICKPCELSEQRRVEPVSETGQRAFADINPSNSLNPAQQDGSDSEQFYDLEEGSDLSLNEDPILECHADRKRRSEELTKDRPKNTKRMEYLALESQNTNRDLTKTDWREFASHESPPIKPHVNDQDLPLKQDVFENEDPEHYTRRMDEAQDSLVQNANVGDRDCLGLKPSGEQVLDKKGGLERECRKACGCPNLKVSIFVGPLEKNENLHARIRNSCCDAKLSIRLKAGKEQNNHGNSLQPDQDPVSIHISGGLKHKLEQLDAIQNQDFTPDEVQELAKVVRGMVFKNDYEKDNHEPYQEEDEEGQKNQEEK